jgi:hypothetical protein
MVRLQTSRCLWASTPFFAVDCKNAAPGLTVHIGRLQKNEGSEHELRALARAMSRLRPALSHVRFIPRPLGVASALSHVRFIPRPLGVASG